MLLIILLVIFVVVMLIWGLALAGSIPNERAGLLAFVAVLVLGIVVFLYGAGVIMVERRIVG